MGQWEDAQSFKGRSRYWSLVYREGPDLTKSGGNSSQVPGAISTPDGAGIPVFPVLSVWGGGQYLLGQLETEVPERVAQGTLSSLIDCGAWLPQSTQRLGLRS